MAFDFARCSKRDPDGTLHVDTSLLAVQNSYVAIWDSKAPRQAPIEALKNCCDGQPAITLSDLQCVTYCELDTEKQARLACDCFIKGPNTKDTLLACHYNPIPSNETEPSGTPSRTPDPKPTGPSATTSETAKPSSAGARTGVKKDALFVVALGILGMMVGAF